MHTSSAKRLAVPNSYNRCAIVTIVASGLASSCGSLIERTAGWLQGVFKFRRIDYFLSAEGSHTSFFREGNVRTGIYPNNSLGKSAVNRFTNYALKTGLTFKIDGRNYIYANAAMLTKAPYFENIYIAPRTRDFQQQNPRSTTVRSAEAGYAEEHRWRRQSPGPPVS